MLKKITPIIITIIIIMLSFSVGVFASDAQNVTNPPYTPEEIEIMRQKDLEVEEYYQNRINSNLSRQSNSTWAMPVTNTYTIPVQNYIQEQNNWCGAACVRQTLSFHAQKNGISLSNLPSQSTIARSLGIYNSGGASSSTMASVLNSYKSTFGFSNYSYSVSNISSRPSKENWLYGIIRTRVVNNTAAPILLFETGGNLTNYGSVSIRHYNTVAGVQETVDINNNNAYMARYIRRADPHYSNQYSGYYYDTLNNVVKSLEKAESNGSNYVIIY